MGEGAERVVNKRQLVALVKEAKNTKDRLSSISGTFGERVKNAVENGHLNKKAFGIVSGLHKIQDELKRNQAIRDTRLYMDMLDEELWKTGHYGDLADQAESGSDEEQDDQGSEEEDEFDAAALERSQADENAALLSKGIKTLSEDGKVIGLPGADAPGKVH